MQDAEYQSYLKKQSYEELVSISHSIDKQAQSERYAMVTAEITEREKSSKEPKQMYAASQVAISRKLLFLGLIPCIFAFHSIAVFALYPGGPISKTGIYSSDLRDIVIFFLAPYLSALAFNAYALLRSRSFHPLSAWRIAGLTSISLVLAFLSFWVGLFLGVSKYGE